MEIFLSAVLATDILLCLFAGKIHVWTPDQMEASMWRLKQRKQTERWKG